MAPQSFVKKAGGAKREAVKATGNKQKVKGKTAAFNAAASASRQKALATRKAKSDAKKGKVGFGALAATTTRGDRDFIDEWLDKRPFIVAFLTSLMRQGSLEKHYNESITGQMTADSTSLLGIRCFAEGATKWRALKVAAAVQLLAVILGDKVFSWFRGDDRLPGAVAQKAVRFDLGVEETTDLPQGIDSPHHMAPMKLLVIRRLTELGGSKLLRVTNKSELETACDWFSIDENNDRVWLHGTTKEDCTVKANWKEASDWCLKDPHLYNACKLISEELGIEMNVARSYEKTSEPPAHADAFDYPSCFTHPGMKPSSGSGVVAASELRSGFELPPQ